MHDASTVPSLDSQEEEAEKIKDVGSQLLYRIGVGDFQLCYYVFLNYSHAACYFIDAFPRWTIRLDTG
jgi:hypothetical protein